jgi:hypothetical protein
MHELTAILSRYKVGQVVDRQSQDYFKIAEYYGETSVWYNLTGSPSIFVGKVGKYGKGFMATDGVKTSALLLKMLAAHNAKKGNTSPTSSEKRREIRVKQAFRKAIKCQIDVAISNTVWPHTCPLSGKVFQKNDRHLYHVDHRSADSSHHPFSTILRLFMLQQNLCYGGVKLDVGGNLKDPELLRNWRNYHRKYADLVVVCASANMSKGAKRDATLTNFWEIKNQP